jgi:hypothetical protein
VRFKGEQNIRQEGVDAQRPEAVITVVKTEAQKPQGRAGVIAVADDGGIPMKHEGLDGTFSAGANISIEKARTAVMFKCSGGHESRTEGHPHVSGPRGLGIISPQGKQPGMIIGPRHPHNSLGDDGKTLSLCARTGFDRIRINIAGFRPNTGMRRLEIWNYCDPFV